MPHHSFMRPPVWHSQQPLSLSPRTVRRPMLMAPALWWAACAACLPRTADKEWRRPVSSTPSVFPSNRLLLVCPLIYYTHTYILLSTSVITFPLFMQRFHRWLFLRGGNARTMGPQSCKNWLDCAVQLPRMHFLIVELWSRYSFQLNCRESLHQEFESCDTH